MRLFVSILLATLVATAGALAQTATPAQSLGWLHATADEESVTHFETNYDGAGYVNVGRVAHPTTPDLFYAPLPSLITGSHTVVVRACNAAGCSVDSAPFTFQMIAGVPAVPSGSQIIPTPGA